MTDKVTNVVFAGLGGQGVVSASDILAEAAFRAGCDVKKSELHGMSQRGGSVSSDVRFGTRVWSPMIPDGEADFLVVLTADQVDPHRHRLRRTGRLILPAHVPGTSLPNRRSLNVAMLGLLGTFLAIPAEEWLAALRARLPERLLEANLAAFQTGQTARESWIESETGL